MNKKLVFSQIKNKIFPFLIKKTLRDKLKKFFYNLGIKVQNEQIQIILSTLKLIQIHTDKIKVPYAKIVALPTTATLKQCVKTLKNSGFSRIPIYKKKRWDANFRWYFIC